MAEKNSLHDEFDSLPDAKLHDEFDAAPSMVDRGIQSNAQQPTSAQGSLGNAMTGGALDTAGDLARGGVQGITAGFSDELMGGGQAALDVLRDPSKAQEFLKLYRQHQQEEQAANEAAAKRSPIAYNIGDYGAAIIPGLLTGGATGIAGAGLKGLGKLAAKGAVYGGAQALGRSTNTIEENPTELLGNVAEGVTAGAVLGPTMKLAPKTTGTAVGGLLGGLAAKQDFEEGNYLSSGAKLLGGLAGGYAAGRLASSKKPAIEQAEGIPQAPFRGHAKEAYKAGKLGEGYNNSKDVIIREGVKKEKSIKNIKDVFDTAEAQLQANKQALFESADDIVLQPEPAKISAIPSFLEFTSKSSEVSKKELAEIADVLDLYSKGGLSPTIAEETRLKLLNMASGVQDPNVRGSLIGTAKELRSAIEKVVPGATEANTDINTFLTRGRETLLSGGKDPNVSGIKISDLPKEDLKTEQTLGRLLSSLRNYTPGTTQDSALAVDKTMKGLRNLFQENPELAKKIPIDFSGLEKQIYTAADQTAVANKLIPGTLGDLKPSSGMFGLPQLGEKGALKAANLAGQAAGSKIVRKASELYRIPKEALGDVVQKLQNSVPGLKSLGDGLAKAIESGDKHKMNATLFTILQNPTARKTLGYTTETEGNGDNFGQ